MLNLVCMRKKRSINYQSNYKNVPLAEINEISQFILRTPKCSNATNSLDSPYPEVELVCLPFCRKGDISEFLKICLCMFYMKMILLLEVYFFCNFYKGTKIINRYQLVHCRKIYFSQLNLIDGAPKWT